MTDPIADYLTRLRNAIHANHRVVEISASKMKQSLTKILFEKGYILSYKFDAPGKENPQGTIKIALKYHPVTKLSAIRELTRVSKPGYRMVFKRYFNGTLRIFLAGSIKLIA